MMSNYIIFRCYVKGNMTVSYIYLNIHNIDYHVQHNTKYVEEKFNPITGKKGLCFLLQKFKEESPFEIDENMQGEVWIRRMKYGDSTVNLEMIMAYISAFFKVVNYHGPVYLTDWSTIDNVRTLKYRLLLGIGSMYEKYGFKPAYPADKSLVQNMVNLSKDIDLKQLRKMYSDRNGKELENFVTKIQKNNPQLSNTIIEIERAYLCMYSKV